MKLSNYSQLTKSLVKKHQIPLDKVGMWQNINKELKKKKKQRRILIFLLLMICGFSGFYFFNDSNILNTNHEYVINNSEVIFNEKLKNSTESENIDKGAKVTKTIKDEQTIFIPKIRGKSISQQKEVQNYKDNSNEITNQKFSKNDIILDFDTIHSLKIIPLVPTIVTFIEPNLMDLAEPKVTLKIQNNQRHLLQVYAGIGYVNRSVSALSSDQVTQEIIRSKESSETTLEQFSVGVDYKYIHNSNFTFSLGAQFRKIAERYTFNHSTQEDFGSFNSFQISKVTSYDYKFYNYQQFVDLAAGVGYNFWVNKNLKYFTEGGLQYTVFSHVEGNKISSELSPYEISHSKIFTNLIHLNLSTGISYDIGCDWALSAETSLLYGFIGDKIENNLLRQKHNIYSLNIGVIKKIK